MTTGLELEDFVEYVDRPLWALYDTKTNCSVDSKSDKTGDKSLTISQQFEDRQQLLVDSMTVTNIHDRSENSNIDMLLLLSSVIAV